MIPVTVDTSGAPVDSIGQLLIEFDVYLDLPQDNLVAFGYSLRSYVNGSFTDWTSPSFFNGSAVVWHRMRRNILNDIAPGASHIQIAIQTIDHCPTSCPGSGSGACHSHSPLIDNVRVATTGTDVFIVTNAADSGPGSLRQAILDADATPNRSIIGFVMPGMLNPPVTITVLSPLPYFSQETVVDARHPALYTGTPLVRIVGDSPIEGHIGFGRAGSQVYGLQLLNPSGPGVRVGASNCVVQACVIEFSNPGILVQGDASIIGGLGAGEANIIRGNVGNGIEVESSSDRVTIRGNQVYGNSGIGIDLDGNGPSANDPLDYDPGANRLQNHPVIIHMDSTRTIRGYLDSAPSQTYTLDFYGNAACNGAGFGGGEVWIGSHVVTTDPTGRATFELNLGASPQPFVTATTTDSQGNTSEFSPCYTPVVVTTTADSGPGSLRQAVMDINTMQGGTIHFDGPWTIIPATPLPSIDYPVFIDGFSAPGTFPNDNPIDQPSAHAMRVTILAGAGLTLGGGLSTVRGIAIGASSNNGITIVGPGGNTIEGCHIGLDHSGTQERSNVRHGIEIRESHGNTIGGVTPAARTLIANGGGNGIWVDRSDSTRIQGCFIGTDHTGQIDFGNAAHGVNLKLSRYCSIGGSTVGARNVIAGNDWDQVYVQGGGEGTVVAGNYIGIEPSGLNVVGVAPQGLGGITLGGAGVMVGGSDPAARNVVAGTQWGLYIGVASDHVVQGNYFGADINGQPLGLSRHGAQLRQARDCLIGGTGPGEGNLFVGADSNGVIVTDDYGPSRNNRIVGNSIHSNGMLGIDLGNDGITGNDIEDLDAGPNDKQNYPQVLADAVSVAGSTYVTLAIFTSPEVFTADLYYSSECDASGNGEGEVWIGSAAVDMTGNNGIGAVPVSVAGVVPGGAYLTATLTDDTGNTSEFSPCGQVLNAPAGTLVESVPVDEATGATPVALTFDEITGGGNTSLTTRASGPPPPEGGFLTSDSTYYDLTTTATFTGSIEVCITYDEALLVGDEANARIMHYDTTLTPDAWVDVTTSVDTEANIVCGLVTKLSPFALSVGTATAVPREARPAMPFALHQNVPNPFNPTTTIGYDVGAGGAEVSLVVYDVAGRRVRTLVDRHHAPGAFRARWDGYNDQGSRVATGVYFYRLIAGSFVDTKKMVLLK